MARIYSPTAERTFKITRWQGLNEAPDGDTKLKMGEASTCTNWRVTRDGNLQIRPGSRNICGFLDGYSLTVSPSVEQETQEETFSFSLWPELTITETGILKPSGSKVVVTDRNITSIAETLRGYYYFSSATQTARRFISAPWSSAANRFVVNWHPVFVSHSSLNAEVKGLWRGYVNGTEYIVSACHGALWKLEYIDLEWRRDRIGDIDTTDRVFMFGFSNMLYILDGQSYKVWNGFFLSDVIGYRPIVSINTAPGGGGTNFEQVNKLTSARRAWFSPDGQSLLFRLPEAGISSIDWVRSRSGSLDFFYSTDADAGTIQFSAGSASESFSGDGKTTLFPLETRNVHSLTVIVDGSEQKEGLDFTHNHSLGELRFTAAPADGAKIAVDIATAPPEGTNTIEVAWSAYGDYRPQITSMRFAETFSGTTDNFVFLYGDGSNKAYYSGIDYDGNPNAEYFPDMNVLSIGDENTPVTSLIRHYSRLVAFKTSSSYSIQYGTITLPDGSEVPAFYSTPVNRSIGHAAPGQAQLVLNDPITLHGQDIYSWKNNSSYSSNLTVDERQARRISDRIAATFGSFVASECVMFDHNYAQELYIVYNDRALVWNYAADAWYYYTDFPARCFVAAGRDLYYGDGDGFLRLVSTNYRNDNGKPITALWRSGSIPFNAEWLKKYTLRIFLGIKPGAQSAVRISVDSDRETDIGETDITTAASTAATFVSADFRDWSFNTDRMPRITRHKLKAKKYAYLRLVLSSESAITTAKLTSADITVRDTVYAR